MDFTYSPPFFFYFFLSSRNGGIGGESKLVLVREMRKFRRQAKSRKKEKEKNKNKEMDVCITNNLAGTRLYRFQNPRNQNFAR